MTAEKIINGNTYLGIELGSTRIKACLIDDSFAPIASGGFQWENKFKNGCWTYDLEDIHKGIKECYSSLRRDVREKFGVTLTKVGAIGISGMMHGYLVFDKNDNLIAPFRTWRNTMTEPAAEELTALFNFNIPQRWSIAHLYQAILNEEAHVSDIAHIATLSSYISYRLTGRWEVGIGEASGMFPCDENGYDNDMLTKFEELIKSRNLPWKIRDILPEIRFCNKGGVSLTEEGAAFLDETGALQAGIPVCPPEGDAGTGMVATNSVKKKTGNISAGTSVFSLLVLEKPLCGVYPEIDVVLTPDASPVALIHSNNGCSELDLWVNMFSEFASLANLPMDKSAVYKLLYENALSGDADCGEVISYNYLASEPVSGVKKGKPLYYRTAESKLNLANFFRSQLYAAIAVLKIGMDMLVEKEGVTAMSFTAHGGLFKVRGVAQQLLANTLSTPISVSETAGEGGAWGMALLSAYMMENEGLALGEWLDLKVFGSMKKEILHPEKNKESGFDKFFNLYKAGLPVIDKF